MFGHHNLHARSARRPYGALHDLARYMLLSGGGSRDVAVFGFDGHADPICCRKRCPNTHRHSICLKYRVNACRMPLAERRPSYGHSPGTHA